MNTNGYSKLNRMQNVLGYKIACSGTAQGKTLPYVMECRLKRMVKVNFNEIQKLAQPFIKGTLPLYQILSRIERLPARKLAHAYSFYERGDVEGLVQMLMSFKRKKTNTTFHETKPKILFAE